MFMPGTETYIALLRGVNLGKAKRIAMADLRSLVEDLGFADPKTLLNSGNVVFRGRAAAPDKVASRLYDAIAASHSFTANVVVLLRGELEEVIAANPFPHETLDHSRLLVAFATSPDKLLPAEALSEGQWKGEKIAIRGRAAFLWLPQGVADSELAKEFGKVTRDAATARNWATVLKIRAAAESVAAADRT
jgi:uncharacterized protein (DUF1697 family)